MLNGSLIINNDNELLNKWCLDTKDEHIHITYGIDKKSMLNAQDIEVLNDSSKFKIRIKEKDYLIKIPVAGKHFIYNSLAAIAVGLEYNINIKNIIKGIEEFSLTKRRMEVITNQKNITIINDSYNASYESIKVALEYLRLQNQKRKIAVLGDVLELGTFSEEIHRKIGKEIIKNNIDILITVGKESKNINEEVKNKEIKKYSFSNNEEAIKLLKNILTANDIVLVKASNGMHFEEIVNAIK